MMCMVISVSTDSDKNNESLKNGTSRVFPRNNKVWAHGPMSLKFDGPFL